MAKLSVRINEAYKQKATKEMIEQLRREQEAKKQRYQAKLAALAEKRKAGKLTLEDVDAKLDVIIEMLQDLMPPK